MNGLNLDDVRALLPDVEAIRPLLDRILATATADESTKWSRSGELGTMGSRRVDPSRVAQELPELLDTVRAHLEGLYVAVLDAVSCFERGDASGAAEALRTAAELERGAGRLTEAGAFLDAAVALLPRIKDPDLATSLLVAGARVARAQGRWRVAETRYRSALESASVLADVQTAARAATGWGNLAIDRGLWRTALDRYRIAEEWVARAQEPLPEAWHLELNRAIVEREEGRLAEAERALSRAEEIVGQQQQAFPENQGAHVAVLNNARGQILRVRGRPGEAELAFRIALDHAADPDAFVTISANLADALIAQGKVLEAGEVVRRAELSALQHATPTRLPELYVLMGRIAEARGHSDGFVFFDRALDIVRKRGLPEVERARVLTAYGAHELRRGEMDTGRAYLHQAKDIYEDLGDRTALQRLQDLELNQGEAGT